MTFRRPFSVNTMAGFLTLALTHGFNFGTGVLFAQHWDRKEKAFLPLFF